MQLRNPVKPRKEVTLFTKPTHKIIYNMYLLGVRQRLISEFISSHPLFATAPTSQHYVAQVIGKYRKQRFDSPKAIQDARKQDFVANGVFERRLHKEIYSLHVKQIPSQGIYARLKADPIFSEEIFPRTVERIITKYNKRLQALYE